MPRGLKERENNSAQVLLYWRSKPPDTNVNRGGRLKSLWEETLWEEHTTDASGRFASGPLWPGDDYRLLVSAKGYTSI